MSDAPMNQMHAASVRPKSQSGSPIAVCKTPESVKRSGKNAVLSNNAVSTSNPAVNQPAEKSPSKKRKSDENEHCCQPKKMILKRVAKDDLEASKCTNDTIANADNDGAGTESQGIFGASNGVTDGRTEPLPSLCLELNGGDQTSCVLNSDSFVSIQSGVEDSSGKKTSVVDNLPFVDSKPMVGNETVHDSMLSQETLEPGTAIAGTDSTGNEASAEPKVKDEPSVDSEPKTDDDVQSLCNEPEEKSVLSGNTEIINDYGQADVVGSETDKQSNSIDSVTDQNKSSHVEVNTDDVSKSPCRETNIEMQEKTEVSEEIPNETSPVIDENALDDIPLSKLALHVRKESKCIKSDLGKFKEANNISRLRVGSVGSLSSHTSDYEYDHVSCDDAPENSFSETDEHCMFNGTERKNGSDCCDNTDIVDSIMISNWQPQPKKTTKAKRSLSMDKENVTDLCFTNIRRLQTAISLKNRNVDSDLDSSGYMSPYGDDVVDGPVGVDNEDGTVSMVTTGRSRPRKTPVKYKDTSFFQGDFVFIEEEEYLNQAPPNRKFKANGFPMDVNHNARKNGHVKNTSKGKNSRSRSKDNKQSGEQCSRKGSPSKSRQNSPSKSKSDISKSVTSSPTRSRNSETQEKCSKESKTATVSSLSRNKNKQKKTSSDDESSEVIKTDPQMISSSKTSPVTKAPKLKIVSSRRSAKGCFAKRTNNPSVSERNGEKHSLNGFQIKDEVKSVSPQLKSKNHSISFEAEKESNEEVIEIISDSSEDNEFSLNISQASDDSKDGVISIDDKTDAPKAFQFTIVEDDIIPDLDPDFGSELEASKSDYMSVLKEEVSDIKPSKESSLANKQAVSKSQKVKRKYTKRKAQQTFADDPDFELGPKPKHFKSIKAQDVEAKKKKSKKDKWANFKGPKIVLEGSKEMPDKCVVINDPFDEIGSKGSKRSKLVTQNVTRIEISHLPSDKSVLIPNSDNTESDQWKCALCGKHSSYKFLGDLFGPYTVETMSTDLLELSPGVALGNGKRRKSEDHQAGSSKSGRKSGRASSVAKETSEWKEVWVHESCAVYSDGVFLIGTKIYGLQEAVRIASQTVSYTCQAVSMLAYDNGYRFVFVFL